MSGVPAGDNAATQPPSSNELHVQVTAPLVFHASGPPPPAPVEAVPLGTRPMTIALSEEPEPPGVTEPAKEPTAPPAAQPSGFFGKVKKFFAKIFH